MGRSGEDGDESKAFSLTFVETSLWASHKDIHDDLYLLVQLGACQAL